MPENGRKLSRLLRVAGMVAGVVLLIIGIRFIAAPRLANWTYGLGREPKVAALDAVIGLRDVWLAGLAIAFAAMREWKALALWLLLGSLVCWGDALIVLAHDGPWPALAFHILSGVFCLWVGWRCWRFAAPRDGN